MKKLSVFLLIFSIILGSITPAYSWPWSKNRKPVPIKTATIQGRVTDSLTNQAISGAAVQAGSYRATTNASGNYSIKNIKVWFWGRIYRVKAEVNGYYSSSRWIYVRKGRTYTLNFRLRPKKPLILVNITSPEDNSYIRGTSLDVNVSWEGRAGIIDLYLDDSLAGSYRTWRWWHRSGNHTFNIDLSSQEDGEHKLKAIAYRSHRRRGYKAESKEITFILDNTSPAISDISPADNALLNNNQPEISAVLEDATSGIDKETIILKLDDVEVAASYDEITGKISYTPSIVLEDGTHTISIEVKDNAGNKASATSAFTVDATPPVITNLQPEDGSTIEEPKPTISAEYLDSLSGIDVSSVNLLLDGEDVTGNATVTDTKITCAPAQDLESGEHTVALEIKDIAGNTAIKTWTFTVEGGAKILNEISSNDPQDLAIDTSRNLYILESGPARIYIYDKDAAYITYIQLENIIDPKGIALDKDNNLYITDTGNNRIKKLKLIEPDLFAYQLDTDFGIDGIVSDTLISPWGITVDDDTNINDINIYVTDNQANKVIEFDGQGKYITDFDRTEEAISDTEIIEHPFSNPKGITSTGYGTIYVADSGNNQIQESSASALNVIIGSEGTGDGEFQNPVDAAVSLYYIYVIDNGNLRVQKFLTEPRKETESQRPFEAKFDNLSLNNPTAIAIDSDLKREIIYIADNGNNRVLRVEIPIKSAEETALNPMKDKLTDKNVEGALEYFSEEVKEKYREILTDLEDELPQIAQDMDDMTLISINGDVAEYIITRIEDGEGIGYFIYFKRDENGEWKLQSF
ncbi:MAG: Ig-like domain-containing protein [bacterium]|nr:Ig-like domain-containing protein [bacterium]